MDDLLTQMGKRIYSRRKQLRLNQEQLAERANLTPQTISSAELGQKALRPENIIKICSALDISTDYLLLGKINAVDSPSYESDFKTIARSISLSGRYHKFLYSCSSWKRDIDHILSICVSFLFNCF